MISCKTQRLGIHIPLQEYRRQVSPDLPMLWRMAGFKPVSQSRALRDIEAFVDKVLSSSEPAIIEGCHASPVFGVSVTRIGRELLETLPLLGLFDSEHDYTEKPYAFLDACWLIESMYRIDLSRVWADPHAQLASYSDALNGVVDKIRLSARQEWFRRGPSDRRYEAGYRANKIRQYVSGLLQRHAKLLLVRVDLGYARFARQSLTIGRLRDDLREFLFLKERGHPAFQHLVGYIWAIEDGHRKGPHVHLLLIYNGAAVWQDVNIGRTVCGLWENRVTGGVGTSRNCNAKKEEYEELGIGLIERHDPDACERAVFFATYLAKDPHGPDIEDSQYVRMKPAGTDVFGTGEQGMDESRSGRPRILPQTWTAEDMHNVRWPNSRWCR